MNGPHRDLQVCNFAEKLKRFELQLLTRHILKQSESLIYSLQKTICWRNQMGDWASGNNTIGASVSQESQKSVA